MNLRGSARLTTGLGRFLLAYWLVGAATSARAESVTGALADLNNPEVPPGAVLAPASSPVSVDHHTTREVQLRRNLGLLIAGGLVLAVGSAVSLTAMAMLNSCYTYCGEAPNGKTGGLIAFPLGVPGVLFGSALLAGGIERRPAHKGYSLASLSPADLVAERRLARTTLISALSISAVSLGLIGAGVALIDMGKEPPVPVGGALGNHGDPTLRWAGSSLATVGGIALAASLSVAIAGGVWWARVARARRSTVSRMGQPMLAPWATASAMGVSLSATF